MALERFLTMLIYIPKSVIVYRIYIDKNREKYIKNRL